MEILDIEGLIKILTEDISAPLFTLTKGRERIVRVVQGSDKAILNKNTREIPLIAWARSLRTAVVVLKSHNVHCYYLQADDINMGFHRERPCAVTCTEMSFERAVAYIRDAAKHPLMTVSRSAEEALLGLWEIIMKAQPRVMAEIEVTFWRKEREVRIADRKNGIPGTSVTAVTETEVDKKAGVFQYRFIEKSGGSVVAEGLRWQPLVRHYYGWKAVNFAMLVRRYEWALGVGPDERIPSRTNRDPEHYQESVRIVKALDEDDMRSVKNNLMIDKL